MMYVHIMKTKPFPPVGTRVQTIARLPVGHMEDLPVGKTGVVVETPSGSCYGIIVRFDEHIAMLDEWNNEYFLNENHATSPGDSAESLFWEHFKILG